MVLKKKPLFLSSLIVLSALLAAVLGLWGFQQFKQGQADDFDQRALDFREHALEDFKQGKLKPSDLLGQAQQVMGKLKGDILVASFLLEVAGQLLEARAFNEAAQLLDQYGRGLQGPAQMKALLGLQLAAAYEDLQQYQKAIPVLNELLPLKVLEDKIYFDLGRYYQRTGDATKAHQSFDYVIKQYPDSSFTPLARLYVSRGEGQQKASKEASP